MRLNFSELSDAKRNLFVPVFYMIMGNSGGASDGWDAMIWEAPFVNRAQEDEGPIEYPGRLAWADGSCQPSPEDPFEVYDYETAKQHILADVLRRGVSCNTAGGNRDSIHYRLVPVYTGLEHLLQPRVMIFSQSPDGTIAPCKEWPADAMDVEEKAPLCHMFGFRNIDPEDTGYSIPTYPTDYANALIQQQETEEFYKGHERWRYFTVPVSNPM